MTRIIFVLGYGSMGHRHAMTAHRLGAEVLVYDPIFDGHAANELRPYRLVSSFDEGLALCTDVVIASPATCHAEQAIRALEAGKPVYIEKPLAMSVAEGLAIQAATAKARVPVAVGYQWAGYEPWVWWRGQITRDWQRIELRYVGDLSIWPGRAYTDILSEVSHELLMAWSFIQGQPMQVCVDELTESCARIRWHGAQRHVLVELDWNQHSEPSRHEWLCERKTITDIAGFNSTRDQDREGLEHAYVRSLAAWLDGKPLCGLAEGLGVLELIEQIRAAA